MIYAVGTGVVSILAIGNRGDIYERFGADPDEAVRVSGDIGSAEPQPFVTTPYDEIPDYLPDGSDNNSNGSDIGGLAHEEAAAADVRADDETEVPAEGARASGHRVGLQQLLAAR